MSKSKERLDILLVDRGLISTRSRAKAVIMAGEVLVDGQRVDKPGTKVSLDAEVQVIVPMPFVSRGGYKLAGALDLFALNVNGLVCADVGACTGGFTDVLLQRGAKRVYAIDVGYGQLDWKLRQDERVIVMERTNVRYLEELPQTAAFVSIDVSFISLKLVLPAVMNWLAEEGDIVALIKPQFEAGPKQVGKGGVVKDPEVHRNVLEEILNWASENDLAPQALIRSPIKGADGNVEFLVHLRRGAAGPASINEAIEAVLGDQ
ncbi:MAG: TlyA family RNA methyltransferase [Candidatus Promineifilaceae bacterium]|jgi:23S rRNA (cytidine1920-2'-O)/16S rRNA (cytidine1409-2'-O)-methyltransferase